MMMLSAWLDNIHFAAEVQHVVASRLSMLAMGDARCASETVKMVSEKVAACAEAQFESASAIMAGQFLPIAIERGFAPYRRRVRANSRRLSKR
jgi:hypothetical protein